MANMMSGTIRQLEAINELNKYLGAIWDLDKIFAETIRLLRRQFPVEAAWFFLRDKTDESLRLRAHYGADTQPASRLLDDIEQAARAVVAQPKVKAAREITQVNHLLNHKMSRALMALPLRYKQTAVGALVLLSQQGRTFSRANRRFAEKVANQVTLAIQRGLLISKFIEKNEQLVRANEELNNAKERLSEWNRSLEKAVEERTHELRSWHDFLQSVIDGLSDAILIVNRDHNVLFANQAAKRLGEVAAESLGRCYDQNPNDRAACDSCPTVRTFATGEIGHTSYSAVGGDGLQHYYEMWTYPIRNKEGHIDRVIEIVRDVSEQKWLEAQLIQAEKMASLGEIASGIAHEIRNPLTGIKLGLNVLKNELNGDSLKLEVMGRIARDIEMLDQVVTQMLDFTRKREVRRESCLLLDVLEKAIFYISKQARDQGIEIYREFKPTPPIQVDPVLMQQVFLNLLLNAVQAMPGGGELHLSIGPQTEPPGIEVVIRDTGPGIPDENRSRIFQPFFSTKPGGTGLGVPISERIVRDHGGQLRIDSEPGKGTSVTIFLPEQ
jgi:signal transduction histidine kinase